MKVGILLCGDVPENLMDEFGSYSQCLQTQLNLNRYESVSEWNVYQKHQFPEDINSCDAYVVGGSPSGVNDDAHWLHGLTLFIRRAFDAGKKLVGICFGHQIINYALGGAVQKAENGWGLGGYDVVMHHDLGEIKAGQRLSLLAIHQDQVTTTATGFDVVAGNSFCPNYITRYKDQVLTVQGHPEFSYSFFKALLAQRKETFTEHQVMQALTKNDSVKHSSMFNKFVHHFIFNQ